MGAKESSHIMASVAGGASVIKDGQRGEAIWVKVPVALVAEDSPCQAQDCYAVCATLPADARDSFALNTRPASAAGTTRRAWAASLLRAQWRRRG